MNKTVDKMTETELKAFGYEFIGQINQAQANLDIINQELKRRLIPKAEVKETPNETKQEDKGTDTVGEGETK
jgi:hypothetical protein